MSNMLIKYIQPKEINDHVDPNFTYLTYGDSDRRGSMIRNKLVPGSYVFFHTSYNQQEYITAYFYIEKILTREKNKAQIDSLNTASIKDDTVVLGSRDRSKVLTYPLPFDKRVVDNLKSLNIDWGKVESGKQSELKTVSDSTRTHRELTIEEVDWLINECALRG